MEPIKDSERKFMEPIRDFKIQDYDIQVDRRQFRRKKVLFLFMAGFMVFIMSIVILAVTTNVFEPVQKEHEKKSWFRMST